MTQPTPIPLHADAETRLRQLDLVMTTLALAVLALPLAVATLVGRGQRLHRLGRDGRPFTLRRLVLPDHVVGRALGRLGAGRWPELISVIAGDLSWVGPAPLSIGENSAAPPPPVRPGLFSSWYVRRRTAVDFDGEAQADAQDLARRSVRHHLGVVARALMVALLPAPADARPRRLTVGDLTIDNLDTPEALARIDALMDAGEGALVCFVNPACVNIAATHRGYRRALSRAALVLPDGIGVKVAGDLLGTPLRQNVNGTDLFPRLLDRLADRRARVFLLGGRPGVPERVATEIGARWPQVRVVGLRDGYFGPADEGGVVQAIRASGADVLLVARGVPAQEIFVDRHGPLLGVKLAIGVGGLFDFVSGRIPRAPQWMREVGAEWVYRLAQEPRRMWRRYLVGNFSFLARVVLQRWGWRRTAADPLPQGASESGTVPRMEAQTGVRGVIFATPTAHPEIPVPRDEPAALLPAGAGTLIERQVAQMAGAGLRDIDIVVCDAPERVRALLGDGARWGVALTWHVVKDPARPYAPLRCSALLACDRLVVAHADAWIDDDTVRHLVGDDGAAVHVDALGQRHWTGWASGPARMFSALSPQSDRSALRWQVLRQNHPCLELGVEQCVSMLDARGLLELQALASSRAAGPGVPLSWIVKPWGACSPQAHVHPEARIDGPVLIDSGSVIQAGARLGPNTWIGRDVVVGAGSHLHDALVMPGTFVGGALDVTHAIVHGRRLRSVRHAVETVVSAVDGTLGSVHRARRNGPSWAGRLAAAVGFTASAPVFAPAALAWRLRRQAWPWSRRPAVVGRHERTGRLDCVALLSCRDRTAGWARLLAGWAGLTDIALGRRAWFGVRARTASQWYSLSAEWQRMLSRAPVGVLHAPAWFATENQRSDAEAAADLFYISRACWQENLRVCAAWLRHAPLMSPPQGQGTQPIPALESPQ